MGCAGGIICDNCGASDHSGNCYRQFLNLHNERRFRNESEVIIMRTKLKLVRVAAHMSQEEAAEQLGCTRATYQAVEGGSRTGSQKFWRSVQETFEIPDANMWLLMKND